MHEFTFVKDWDETTREIDITAMHWNCNFRGSNTWIYEEMIATKVIYIPSTIISDHIISHHYLQMQTYSISVHYAVVYNRLYVRCSTIALHALTVRITCSGFPDHFRSWFGRRHQTKSSRYVWRDWCSRGFVMFQLCIYATLEVYIFCYLVISICKVKPIQSYVCSHWSFPDRKQLQHQSNRLLRLKLLLKCTIKITITPE